MRIVVTVLTVVLAIVLTIFSAQNTLPVQLRFLTFQSNAFPLALVIVLSIVGGVLLMGLFWLQDIIRRGFRYRNEAKARTSAEKRVLDLELRVAQLTEENTRLKGQPGAAPPTPTTPAART